MSQTQAAQAPRHKAAGSTPSFGDAVFRRLVACCAGIGLLIMFGILVVLVVSAWPALKEFGFSFLISQEWNPVTSRFGAAATIFGTIVSTAIAMVIAWPLSLIIALFLVEIAPRKIASPVGTGIELLAAVPSIIYGMWGLFVFAPFMAEYVQPFLAGTLGFLPLFEGPPMGIGMLSAGIVLALMILPFMTAVTREVFDMVPSVIKEAASGMGSTTWEVTWKVVVRYGMGGILGAALLGIGRALGETMAVTFVIGNAHRISPSLFAPGNTIASTLANEFTEASEPMYLAALVELGLVLFAITFAFQLVAFFWLKRIRKTIGDNR